MTEAPHRSTPIEDEIAAMRAADPAFAAAYDAERAKIDAYDARVRAAIAAGRLPADVTPGPTTSSGCLA